MLTRIMYRVVLKVIKLLFSELIYFSNLPNSLVYHYSFTPLIQFLVCVAFWFELSS